MIPKKGAMTEAPALRLIAWEVTRSCLLGCRHCRAGSLKRPYERELSIDECKMVFDSIAGMGRCIVILTGGEPMLRGDIYDIARYGHDRGLRMALAPCGLLLDKASCRALIDAGIERISLSIDGATAKTHDAFRGYDGAFEKLMAGIEAARSTGLAFQINTTVTRTNLPELPAILDLAVTLKAVSFHPFLLVPTGRGSALMDEMITPQQYESTLEWFHEQSLRRETAIKPTCAPHYYRIIRQHGRATGNGAPGASQGLDTMTKGCIGGQSFAFISHTGVVQICGFLQRAAGDLRASGYDFPGIWRSSELFREIRAVDLYRGKCGVCEYRAVCGGCRARAFASSGDYCGEEPQCLYEPKLPRKETGKNA
jgi:heme b synthase